MAKHHLAARVFGTPLLISPSKLDVILGALGPRLGLDLPRSDAGPETEAKARASAQRVNVSQAESASVSRIAVVQVVGTLANRVDSLDAMSGLSGYETMGEEIDRLAADPEVDAILLEVDSFGGEAAGCFDLANRINAARARKPVYGVANQYAMSAGYALLSQADRIFVPQSGEVGSIGVVTTHMDFTEAAAKQGVRVTHVHAGAHKVDTSPFKAMTPEVRDRLAADVGQVYDQFLGVVAQGRGARLDATAARKTESLTYVGERAVEAGLADDVGTKTDALAALHEEVKTVKRTKELEDRLAAAQAEIVTLKAQLADRIRADDEAYMKRLADESATAQAPIDAAKLAKVKAHLDAGRHDVARELGDELLERALADGQKKFTRTTRTTPAVTSHEVSVKRGILRNERRSLQDALRAGTADKAAAKNRIEQITAELGDAAENAIGSGR